MIVDNVLRRTFVKVVVIFLDADESFDGSRLIQHAFREQSSRVTRLGTGGFVTLEGGAIRGHQLNVQLYALASGTDSEQFARAADTCLFILGERAVDFSAEVTRIGAVANATLTRVYAAPAVPLLDLIALPYGGPAGENLNAIVRAGVKAFLKHAATEPVRVTELNTLDEVMAAATLNTLPAPSGRPVGKPGAPLDVRQGAADARGWLLAIWQKLTARN